MLYCMRESSLGITCVDMYASYTVNLGLGYITHDSHYQWISISLSRMLAFIDLLYLLIYAVSRWIMTESSQFIRASGWLVMIIEFNEAQVRCFLTRTSDPHL